MNIGKLRKSTASESLKPLEFVSWEWQQFRRLLSSKYTMQQMAQWLWIYLYFTFIITDYDDTMIWIYFLYYCIFCGNPPFVCEFPSDCANDAVLWCKPEQSAEQTVYCPVIWDVMRPIWHLCDITLLHIFHWSQILSNNVVVHKMNRLNQKISLTCE